MKSETAVAAVVPKGVSQAKLRAQAKARKRMVGIVASLQAYVGSYDKQSGYSDYTDKTLIDDMLYGLGRAVLPAARWVAHRAEPEAEGGRQLGGLQGRQGLARRRLVAMGEGAD